MKKLLVMLLALSMLIGVSSVVTFAEDKITADGMSSVQIIIKDENTIGGSISKATSTEIVLSGDICKYTYTDTSDPQVVLEFDEEIDVAKYPFVVIKAKDSAITEETKSACGYYNEKGSGATGSQVASTDWVVDSDWQWLVFDYSEAVCNIGFIRFDPTNAGVEGKTGAIAGVFAFESLEKFNAWKDTDAAKNLGSNEGDKQVVVREKPTLQYFGNLDTKTTGWWCNGPFREAYFSMNFESTTWFCGMRWYIYASQNPANILCTLYDDDENEVWSSEVSCVGDAYVDMYFDDANGNEQKLQPGYYTFTIETLPSDDEDVNNNTHIVLGSCDMPSDVDMEIEDYVLIEKDSFNTNGNTKECPAMAFIVCEAGEIKTAAPATDTPVPTDTPAPTDTPEPTDEPVKATDVPAESTEAPSEKKSGCGSVIGGMSIFAIVALGGVCLLKKKQ